MQQINLGAAWSGVTNVERNLHLFASGEATIVAFDFRCNISAVYVRSGAVWLPSWLGGCSAIASLPSPRGPVLPWLFEPEAHSRSQMFPPPSVAPLTPFDFGFVR